MSDYKENALVVQSNHFVRETSNNLKAAEIKMFDVFVSCIDTLHPKKTIEIKKTELMKALGDNDQYRFTRETLRSLMQKVWVEAGERSAILRHFVDKAEWFYQEDSVKVTFSEDILPMLVDLKSNFLQYSVADLNCLRSRYSMLLYKYCLSYIRQYKTTDFIIPMSELRDFLNLKNKYDRFEAFDRKVLQVFEKEVNDSRALPYLVRYEKQLRNRKVDSIRFLIRPRTTNNETVFGDVQNQIAYEEMYNHLIKGNTPIGDIRNRQADEILEQQTELF